MIPSNDKSRAAFRWGAAAMVLVALAAWPAWPQEVAAGPPEAEEGSLALILEQPVSLEFDEPQHLAEVAASLYRQCRANIAIDWRVVEAPPAPGASEEAEAVPDGDSGGPRKIPGMVPPMHVTDLPLRSALAGMLRAIDLAYSEEPHFIWISTPEHIRNEPFGDPEINVPEGRRADLLEALKSPMTLVADGRLRLNEIIKELARFYSINVVVDGRAVKEAGPPDARMPASGCAADDILPPIWLRNVSVREGLQPFLRGVGLSYSVEDGFVWISTPELIEEESFDAPGPAGRAVGAAVSREPAPDLGLNQIVIEILPAYARIAGLRVGSDEVRRALEEAADRFKDSKPIVVIRVNSAWVLDSELLRKVLDGCHALGLNVLMAISEEGIDDMRVVVQQRGVVMWEAPREPFVKMTPARARIWRNETAAAEAVKAISRGQIGFRTAGFFDADGDGQGDYGTLAQLGNPDGKGEAPPFIDSELASGEKDGYLFVVSVVCGTAAVQPAYTCTAEPVEPGMTGNRCFFVEESGIIRYTSDGTKATIISRPLH